MRKKYYNFFLLNSTVVVYFLAFWSKCYSFLLSVPWLILLGDAFIHLICKTRDNLYNHSGLKKGHRVLGNKMGKIKNNLFHWGQNQHREATAGGRFSSRSLHGCYRYNESGCYSFDTEDRWTSFYGRTGAPGNGGWGWLPDDKEPSFAWSEILLQCSQRWASFFTLANHRAPKRLYIFTILPINICDSASRHLFLFSLVCEIVGQEGSIFDDGKSMMDDINNFEDAKALVAEDGIVEKIENRVKVWIKKLKDFILESKQVRGENDNSGPQQELEYWKRRGAQFSQLAGRLEVREPISWKTRFFL